MTHHERVLGYPGSLAELAEEIGDLRYDALARFLESLSAKLGKDAEADAGRGRRKLAEALRRASGSIAEAGTGIGEAWRISEPYMTDRENS